MIVPLFGVAALSALAVPAYLVGRAVLCRVRFLDRSEGFALSTTLGLGLLSHLLLLLGLVRLLRAGAILVLLAGLAAASVALLGRRRIPLLPVAAPHDGRALGDPGRLDRRARVVVALLVPVALLAAAAPYLLIPFYPPTAFDATSFHLATAKEFAREGAVVVVPHLRFPVYTFGVHVLFASLLSFGSEVAPALLSLLFSGLVALLLVSWGRSAGGRWTGFAAALLWLCSPLVLYVSTIPYIDAGQALFVSAAGYAFWRWRRGGSLELLAASGAFAGFACSTKYSALVALAVLGGSLVVLAVLRRTPVRALLVFAAAAFAAGAPWYLRNAVLTGNPTWPLLGGLFGVGPWWNGTDLAGAWADLRTPGCGRDAKALLLLPWNLLAHGERFYADASIGLSRAIPLALPLVVVGAATLASGWVVAALLASLAASWFFGSQVLRYLVPALPLYAVLAACGFSRLLEARPLRNRPRLAAALGLLIACALPVSVARVGWRQLLASGRPPFSPDARDAFVVKRFPESRTLLAVPRVDAAVYSLFGANLAYYSPARFAGDWFGPWPYRSAIAAARSGGASLQALLRGWGFDYLHVARNAMYSQAKASLPDDEDFRRLFRPVAVDDHGELYEILGAASPLPPGLQLLRNPGFEGRDAAERGAGWSQFGAPRFDGSGAQARSGRSAALVDGENTVFQVVPVEPERAYRLRLSARAASGPGASVRLQVNWLDATGKAAGGFLRPVPVETGWTDLDAVCRAPANARKGVVFGSCHSGCAAGVWLDDVTLTEIPEAPPLLR